MDRISVKKYGWSLGIFLVVYGLIYRFADLDRFSIAGWVFYMAIPVVLFLWYRQTDKFDFTFKNVLKYTLVLTLIGNGVYSAFVYVFNKFFDDSLLQKTYAQGMDRIQERELTGQSLELAKKQIELFTTPELFTVIIFIQLMLFSLACGIVFALLSKPRS